MWSQRRKHASNDVGLMILGNSGVGKSFLANILSGCDCFIHSISSTSITKETEYIERQIESLSLTIFNIPGLIEVEEEYIDLNKVEIDKAFAARSNCMILFVFGHQQGRIRDEDVMGFNAINAAYSFRSESLCIVVNGLPKTRPRDYERTTVDLLQKLLINSHVNRNNLCFIDTIDPNSMRERNVLQNQLAQILVELTPKKHRKKKEINTLMDELQICQKLMVEQQEHFEEERRGFEEELEENQEDFNRKIARYQSKTQSLRRTFEHQKKNFKKEERRLTADNKAQNREVKQVTEELRKIRNKYRRLERELDD